MATRFYFIGGDATKNSGGVVTPTVDGNWNISSPVAKGALILAGLQGGTVLSGSPPNTVVPITTTQNIIMAQHVSPPLDAQTITGTVSAIVAGTFEDAATNNVTLAISVRLISGDGTVVRGTMFSVFGTDTEFDNVTPSTRIVNAQTLTSQTSLFGDRILVEIGLHATAPTAGGHGIYQYFNNQGADFALTSGLTTTLNTWIEFSQNLIILPGSAPTTMVNYQFLKVGNGMSVSEKIR